MAKRNRTDGEPDSLEMEIAKPTSEFSEDVRELVIPVPEPEPEPVSESPQPAPKESGTPALPVIRLDVFLAMCGSKWDQMAGFKRYAIREKLAPRTVPGWRTAHAAFMNRPTR